MNLIIVIRLLRKKFKISLVFTQNNRYNVKLIKTYKIIDSTQYTYYEKSLLHFTVNFKALNLIALKQPQYF